MDLWFLWKLNVFLLAEELSTFQGNPYPRNEITSWIKVRNINFEVTYFVSVSNNQRLLWNVIHWTFLCLIPCIYLMEIELNYQISWTGVVCCEVSMCGQAFLDMKSIYPLLSVVYWRYHEVFLGSLSYVTVEWILLHTVIYSLKAWVNWVTVKASHLTFTEDWFLFQSHDVDCHSAFLISCFILVFCHQIVKIVNVCYLIQAHAFCCSLAALTFF